MPVALGFIETNSLIGAAEAANVMTKTSNIILLEKEVIAPGSITIKIIGEEESVEAAINAGTEAVRKLEKNVSSHIIADPDEQVFSVLPEIRSLYFSLKKKSKRKIKKPDTEKKRIETDKSKAETKKPGVKTGKSKIKTEKPRAKAKKLKVKRRKPKVKSAKLKIKTRKTKVKTEKAKVKNIKPKVKAVKPKAESKKRKVEAEKPKVDAGQPELEKSVIEIKEIEEPKIEKQEQEAENVLTNEESFQENEDIFIVHHPIKRLRTNSIKNTVEEKVPEIKERKRTSYRNKTIERLRMEALGLNKADKKKPVKQEIKKKEESKNKKNNNDSNLDSLNVHELRKLARSKKKFPIQGREISKAKREALLDYFKNLK